MQRADFINKSLKLLFQNYHQACKEAEFDCFQPCIILMLGTFNFQINI